MQDITVARLQSIRVQNPLSPPFKCNVLCECLSEDSQISIYLCRHPTVVYTGACAGFEVGGGDGLFSVLFTA
jgi:hypothetical protein